MILNYIDESYTEDRYLMVALACPDHVAIPLTNALDEIVLEIGNKYGARLDWNPEFHGHDLFHGERDWKCFKSNVSARVEAYSAALKAIAAHDIYIILRGVHRKRLVERYINPYPPHSVVLAHLLERIDEYAEKRNEVALVIADEVSEKDKYRKDLSTYRQYGTEGYRARKITNVVDTLHFAPSTASRLLQAADLVVYLWCRLLTGKEKNERAEEAKNNLWALIEPKIVHRHVWWP